jgi:hypothetical protein
MKKAMTGFLALSLLVIMGQGCNPFKRFEQSVGEEITERVIERSTGGQVEIGIDGEAKLPSSFPEDVPRYPDARYVSASVTNEGKIAIANFKTGDSATEVQSWFKSELEAGGFALDTTFALGGSIQYYTKGDIRLTVQTQERDGETVVSIQRAE